MNNNDHVLTLEELEATAPLAGPPGKINRVRWRSRVGAPSYRPGRRHFLKAAVTVGTTAGLMTLGVFPKARQATAECIAELEAFIREDCPSGYADGCRPACSPSMVLPDCCITIGTGGGHHKFTGDYRNRPDQCRKAGTTFEHDGWEWWARKCPDCPEISMTVYRCHDGCKRIDGAWRNTICQKKIRCEQ